MSRLRNSFLGALAAGIAVLLAGCSHGAQSPGQSAVAQSPASSPSKPSAAGIQADMAKVNADPGLSAAQKQIMLNQMNHAQAMQPRR